METILNEINIGPLIRLQARLGKTGSLGPWRGVMVYRSKPSLCQNDPPMSGSFWHSEGFLQCTMTLLQGQKKSGFAQPKL